MKPLRPSHREKRRYLLLTGKDASQKNVEEAILKFIGILGFAKASPQFIKTNEAGIIMSINRSELEKVRASFLLSGKDINIKKVSGLIGKLK